MMIFYYYYSLQESNRTNEFAPHGARTVVDFLDIPDHRDDDRYMDTRVDR